MLTALLCLSRPSLAQSAEASIDAGGTALRYADTLSTGAGAITPHVSIDWESGFVDAGGTYSQFTAGGWSTQGALSGSRFIQSRSSLMLELAGLAGGSTHSDGTKTGEGLLSARLHLGRSTREFFVGAGGGRAWDGDAWRSVRLGEVGASIAMGPRGATLTVSPAIVNDSLRYADTQASLSWRRERLDLGAVLGFRVGDQVATTSASAKSWASVTAVAWMNPRIGLVASGGTYPIDPTQGFPGGRFVSLALRFTTNRASAQALPPIAPQDDIRPEAPAAAVTGFNVEREQSGSVTLKAIARGAQSVEITGDFTNWVPLRMEPDGALPDSWARTLPLKGGKYQMNIRIDGGAWTVPPGILSMLDEFGGRVGLLVVQ
ncbi:MAG: glycogen-binding domain-containing protein [Gemmatimonadaceae bacterium]